MSSPATHVALSIKQPWATLILHGLKTIEVRRWSTRRRGCILIHASRQADARPEAWKHVPEELQPQTHLRGGILGSVELIDCRAYGDVASFQADHALHRNESDWFERPVLYGLILARPELLPFQACPGWFRFFSVPDFSAHPSQSIP